MTDYTLLEIDLVDDNNFLKVKETLERIGVANYTTKTLYQSCHILHKKQRFYIVHFKEMFILDGKTSTLTDEDYRRRNTIAKLLEDWGLITIVENPDNCFDDQRVLPAVDGKVQKLKILTHKDKPNWNLVTKYSIGKKKE